MILFFPFPVQPRMSISYTRGNVRPLLHAALTCNNNITSTVDGCLRGLEVVGAPFLTRACSTLQTLRVRAKLSRTAALTDGLSI